VTDTILLAALSTRAITALESWVQRKNGRAFTVEIVDGRFRIVMADSVMVGGNSLADALAQASQLAILEEEPAT
jgi:hypothetical protein